MGWDLTFRHGGTEDAHANCLLDGNEKWCVVRLTTDWNGKDKPLTQLELDIAAYHEVLHLRLGSLRWLAKSRYTSEAEIDKADEETVVALENFHRAHY